MASRSREQTLQFVRKAASHYGWVLNPDSDFVEVLAEGLTVNANRHGYYMCPCRDGDGDRTADRDIVCPCVYAAKDIEEYGQCFCGLFLSAERAADTRPISQIPERRYRDL
jgi:ferredoxin-thioredoxin reductase catalytic chain